LAGEQPWPRWRDEFLREDEVEIVIQVNGKMRDKMTIRKDLEKTELEQAALMSIKVRESVRNKSVRKIIVVPNKLVNIVAE
jgi:leucyl-tRNA synthetase